MMKIFVFSSYLGLLVIALICFILDFIYRCAKLLYLISVVFSIITIFQFGVKQSAILLSGNTVSQIFVNIPHIR